MSAPRERQVIATLPPPPRTGGYSGRIARLVAAVAMLASAGCQSAWRPPVADAHTAPTTLHVDLSQRLPPVPSRSVYRRTSKKLSTRGSTHYVVQTTANMQQEGVFADTRSARLEDYMAGEAGAEPAAKFTWPRWEPDSAGLMLRFDPPLAYLPRRLDARGRTHAAARVLLHDPKGKQTDSGKVERSVYLEGYATVTAGNRTYTDCVCLRTETRLHFPWLARIAFTEYLWLAPNVGIVRRLQRIRGRILIRHFEDVIEDELIRCELPEKQNTGEQSVSRLGEHCSAAVIYLQPAQPVPCVAGAVMQFLAEETGAASAR